MSGKTKSTLQETDFNIRFAVNITKFLEKLFSAEFRVDCFCSFEVFFLRFIGFSLVLHLKIKVQQQFANL